MIYLINPYITSKERYGKDIGDIGGHQLPLGIYYLASYLLKHNFSVQVIDAEAEGLAHEEVVKILKNSRVKIIGITSTSVAFGKATLLAQMIRRALPSVQLVIGGPQMTAMPMEAMETGAFKYGIVGEGESAFYQLVSFLLKKTGKKTEIPNLYYLDGNEVCANPARAAIKDLDTIPFPARQLVPDLAKYKPPVSAYQHKPVANVITSRGCPYECIFCDNNTFGRKIRFFSAKYVAAEIETLIKGFNIKEIAFLDDTFIINKKRLFDIFNILDEKGISFPWTCMTRVDNLDYETLKFMKNKGCWQIRIGIESGNQEVLEFIKKGITLKQVRDVTAWCADLKIKTTGFFIIGHHIDTSESIQETIDFALSIPLTDVVVTVNTPIPNTESYELARSYGEYREQDWTALNYWTPVFVPTGLSESLILKKQAEFYRKFYSRPKIILKQIGKIKDLESLIMFARNALLGINFLKN